MAKITKEMIFENSLNIIMKDGFEKFTIAKLSTSLDCAKSSIYYHFTNKDEIINELVKNAYFDLEIKLTGDESVETIIDLMIDSAKQSKKYLLLRMYANNKVLKDNLHDKMRDNKIHAIKILYEKSSLKEIISFKVFSALIMGPIMSLSMEKHFSNEKIAEEEIKMLSESLVKIINNKESK